jgi:hypothetical protein
MEKHFVIWNCLIVVLLFIGHAIGFLLMALSGCTINYNLRIDLIWCLVCLALANVAYYISLSDSY